jgi:diguanylate cyclase (GGDEF)-like protein
MTDPSVLIFSATEGGLFSPEEVRGLMAIEFERSTRYAYPLGCLLIAVDRLQYLQDLYGYDSKSEILEAVAGLLASTLRSCDLLGQMVDDRLIVLLPHATTRGMKELADRFLDEARGMTFDSGGPALKVTLTIGAANTEVLEEATLATLVHTAETGLAVGVAAGGDRYIEWREVQQEVDDLRHELQEQAEELAAGNVFPAAPGEATGPAEHPRLEDAEADALMVGRIAEVFETFGDGSVAFERTRDEVTAIALELLQQTRHAAGAETSKDAEHKIDLLERRVAKLSDLLGIAESELKRIAKMKNIDLGIASIYRTVQGLSEDDDNAERKKEMMADIFQANVALKQKLDELGSGS